MKKKEKLAIFDLDGTLFNTNEVNYYSYKKALEKFNIKINKREFIQKMQGRKYKTFIKDYVNNSKHIEEIHKLKKIYYKNFLNKAKINLHLFDIIKLIKSEYIISIATTASKKNSIDILNYFEVNDLFDYIVTQEDVSKNKPNPECFFKIMDYFKIKPYNTIIFEDSDIGIKSAQKTGATVFTVNKF